MSYVEHSQIGDAESAALEFMGLQFAVSRLSGQRFHVTGNVGESFAVCIEDNWRDQSTFR